MGEISLLTGVELDDTGGVLSPPISNIGEPCLPTFPLAPAILLVLLGQDFMFLGRLYLYKLDS